MAHRSRRGYRSADQIEQTPALALGLAELVEHQYVRCGCKAIFDADRCFHEGSLVQSAAGRARSAVFEDGCPVPGGEVFEFHVAASFRRGVDHVLEDATSERR